MKNINYDGFQLLPNVEDSPLSLKICNLSMDEEINCVWLTLTSSGYTGNNCIVTLETIKYPIKENANENMITITTTG